jgi:hypothetical protein
MLTAMALFLRDYEKRFCILAVLATLLLPDKSFVWLPIVSISAHCHANRFFIVQGTGCKPAPTEHFVLDSHRKGFVRQRGDISLSLFFLLV